MADNRIEIWCGDRHVVIAVRHGDQWRSAVDDKSDVGTFLNSVNKEDKSSIVIRYEDERQYCDPRIELGE